MPKQIYNEGRVVGLSSYEIYVREYLSQGNQDPPASEREWLSSSLAFGSSMLLRVPPVTPAAGTEDTEITIDFPTNSKLCAANTIVASFFNGDAKTLAATLDSHTSGSTVGAPYWGTQVTDYGELISNTSSLSPSNPTIDSVNVPVKSTLAWSDTVKDQLNNYMNIVDGIIIQPGVWSTVDSADRPPQKDLAMDPSKPPQIRLHIHGSITTAFWILLTGFSIRTVVVGESGIEGSVATDSPQDGDFLGPATFPWASKIIFSIPPNARVSGGSGVYSRSITPILGGTTQSTTVDDSAIIDLKYSSSAFASDWQDSIIQYTVSDVDSSSGGAAVLGVFPRYAGGFRGLYASTVTASGQAVMEPIDCHAPGTTKLFHHPNPGTTADDLLLLRASGVPNSHILSLGGLSVAPDLGGRAYYEYVNDGNSTSMIPIAATSVSESSSTVLSQTNQKSYSANILTGEQSIQVLSLVKWNSAQNRYDVLPTSGTSSPAYSVASGNNGNLNWDMLKAALGNNKSIDILGDSLKQLRSSLSAISADKQYAIILSGGQVSVQEVAALPNFFFTSLDCQTVNFTSGADNIYDGVRLDLFGFSTSDASTTGIVNTFGTFTVLAASSYSFGAAYNWFQPFKIKSAYQSSFDTLITRLNPANVAGLNVVKIACMPVTNYRSVSGNVDNGAPITNTPNVWAAYLNATDGNSTNEEGNKYDGILYVRNSGSTQNASQVSVLCSVSLYHSSNRPRCRRSNTAQSGYLAW